MGQPAARVQLDGLGQALLELAGNTLAGRGVVGPLPGAEPTGDSLA